MEHLGQKLTANASLTP
jgi:hypothetical protein